MAFSDVGCGTNACWFKFLLCYRMLFTVLFAASALLRRIQAMTSRNSPDSSAVMFIDLTYIALCGMNLYFHYIALNASNSVKCERHLWRRWSNYMKILMIIVGAIGGLMAVMTLALGLGAAAPEQMSALGPVLMAFIVVIVTVSWLIGEGLVLLLTKNRFEEKVQEEAARRGGEGEYLKPV